MKISNSKKQLAKIIHENGGWRDGAEFAAQDSVKDSCPCRICFYSNKPKLKTGARRWFDGNNGIVGGAEGCIHGVNAISNWHQTRLSRDEYFHLYQEQGLEAALDEPFVSEESKPTIEQLAADYRNRKDYADRKQQEADAAKADAEAKLAELVAAGKALGLAVSVAEPEPELVITDWRDLQVGDRIWVGDSGRDNNCQAGEYDIVDRDHGDDDQPVGVMWRGRVEWPQIHKRGWRFINRPAQGDTNA